MERSDRWNLLTERARRAFYFAREAARRHRSREVDTPHLLLGMLVDEDNVAERILREFGVTRNVIRRKLLARMEQLPKDTDLSDRLSATCVRVVQRSYEEADRLQQDWVGTEHLLLGLLAEDESIAWRVLTEAGVERDRVRSIIRRYEQEVRKAGGV